MMVTPDVETPAPVVTIGLVTGDIRRLGPDTGEWAGYQILDTGS